MLNFCREAKARKFNGLCLVSYKLLLDRPKRPKVAPLSKPDSEALLHFHDNADYKFELFSLQGPTQKYC